MIIKILLMSMCSRLIQISRSMFVIVGKEYVCIVRLHEAIEKVADLAKVSTTFEVIELLKL